MTALLLILMALAFMAIAAILTAAEAAYNFLPRHDAEHFSSKKRLRSLKKILEQPLPHVRALRFWRVWFEMASAVAVALLLQSLLDNIWLAGLAATVIMAGVGFVLVGVSPRQFGRVHSSATVRLTAPLIRFLCWVLGPIPAWLVRLGSTVTPGGPTGDEAFFTNEEFRELVDRASESDMIEDNEAELIQSVFDLGDTLVRSVMVPRTDIVFIDAGSTPEQAMELFLRSGNSRMPVIGESTDDILGILYLKDVAAVLTDKQPGEPGPAVETISRTVRYVPESKQVAELLKELQIESTHLAIVIDEYGGTAGLVTLEDLIEEIVGEIVDEYDSEAAESEALEDGTFRVSARMNVADLGELFGKDIDDDDVDTAGGLLAKELGRVPIVGSVVEVQGIELRAERIEGRRNRISHIIARWVGEAETEDTESSSDARVKEQGAIREQEG
ncbi:hemolysin family protein [Pseudarthrobacter sp. J1763]|uniref:hemolysin family protein n=1 Tax=Pseudarthrobacter sp. J1763 TaxID=3420445 RepID=UPI003D2DA94B